MFPMSIAAAESSYSGAVAKATSGEQFLTVFGKGTGAQHADTNGQARRNPLNPES